MADSALVEISNVQSDRVRWYCDQLERGKILFFRDVPFDFPQADRDFLLSQKQTGSRFHKNISYRPSRDILKGVSSDSPDRERLQGIMRHFSQAAAQFVSRLLAPYAAKLQMDFASFRPLEEMNRALPLHKRNDLLHVDAFPSRPTRGARILRCFTNLNPSQPRKWLVGERFPELAKRYAGEAGLARMAGRANPSKAAWHRGVTYLKRAMGMPAQHR